MMSCPSRWPTPRLPVLLISVLGWRPVAWAPAVGVAAGPADRLAVVIPVLSGNMQRAVLALDRWPLGNCSTQEDVDLFFYYEPAAEDEVRMLVATVENIVPGTGSCFEKFYTVGADIEEKERVDPLQSRNTMFYKMFLGDTDVRRQLAAYDALAVVEWEHAVIATGPFYENLYLKAQQEQKEEGVFWIKATATSTTSSVIYNNRDSDFVEYVAQAREQWGLREPYEETLSRSPSHLHDGKFVRVDAEVDGDFTPVAQGDCSSGSAAVTIAITASDASTNGHHLLTSATGKNEQRRQRRHKTRRGSSRKNGEAQDVGYANRQTCDEREPVEGRECGCPSPDCRCDAGCAYTSRDGTKGRVCDPSCKTGDPYGTMGCGAREGRYGEDCRVCFNDVARARKNDSVGWQRRNDVDHTFATADAAAAAATAAKKTFAKNATLTTTSSWCDTLEPVEADSSGGNLGQKWPKQERWIEQRKYGRLL